MKQKRYEVVAFAHVLNARDLQQTLTSFALQGWRLHTIRPRPDRYDQLIFERDWDSEETPAGLR